MASATALTTAVSPPIAPPRPCATPPAIRARARGLVVDADPRLDQQALGPGGLLLLGERGVVLYLGEVFPTEALRGIGTGFAAAVSRVGAGLGTFLLPIVVERFGVSATVSRVSQADSGEGRRSEHGSRSGSSQHHGGGAAWVGRPARTG